MCAHIGVGETVSLWKSFDMLWHSHQGSKKYGVKNNPKVLIKESSFLIYFNVFIYSNENDVN